MENLENENKIPTFESENSKKFPDLSILFKFGNKELPVREDENKKGNKSDDQAFGL